MSVRDIEEDDSEGLSIIDAEDVDSELNLDLHLATDGNAGCSNSAYNNDTPCIKKSKKEYSDSGSCDMEDTTVISIVAPTEFTVAASHYIIDSCPETPKEFKQAED